MVTSYSKSNITADVASAEPGQSRSMIDYDKNNGSQVSDAVTSLNDLVEPKQHDSAAVLLVEDSEIPGGDGVWQGVSERKSTRPAGSMVRVPVRVWGR